MELHFSEYNPRLGRETSYDYEVDDEIVIKVLSEFAGEIDSSNFLSCVNIYRVMLEERFYKRAYREYLESPKDYRISFRKSVNIEYEVRE